MICVEGRLFGKDKGYVLIEDNHIIKVGKGTCKEPVDKIKGNLILPGFVNGHVHAGMYAYRGFGKKRGLEQFFKEILFPLEQQITKKEIYEGAKQACEEMIAQGITGMFNMNPWYGPVLRAVKKIGIRASLAIAIKRKKDLKRNLKIPKTFHPMLGIANGKETPENLIREIVQASRNQELGIHTHLAESKEEVLFIKSRFGVSSIKYFDSLGVLGKHTLLVHMVHADTNDLVLVKRRGCTVTLNPRCNEILGVGKPRIKTMLSLNIPLMLGTDEPVADPTVNVKEIGLYVMKRYKVGFTNVLNMLTNGCLFGPYGLKRNALADITVWDCKLREILTTKPEHVIVNGKVLI